ncbi:MAG TPA: hypothetical protein VL197_15820 [Nitrospirota bacterium]|nr:hypothetical protein [Nitrospirota bacterium]
MNINTSADVVQDFNSFPYPFGGTTFDGTYVDNVLEHLDDVIKGMEEL